MPLPFDLAALSRVPDVASPELSAVDAADRLILDESAAARALAGDGAIAVIGDAYGALTLGAAAEGARGIRVHQDALTGERALANNAETFGLEGTFESMPLDAALVRDARVVLLRLPRSLEELEDVATVIAAHAAPDVEVFAGGRLKHMTIAMNEVLGRHFGRLDVTHARQKSRVLLAREPLRNAGASATEPTPRQRVHPMPGFAGRVAAKPGAHGPESITVCAFGGAFAGVSIDIGTRFLLEQLPTTVSPGDGLAIDFACGTGLVAAWLALHNPELEVYASDQSAVAVASAKATAAANGVAERVRVVRDDGLALLPDASASFIALNPPFHVGAAVHTGVAPTLFAEAARVLATGGELWAVWNSALNYRGELARIVGPTRQVARNTKFTVTVSTLAAPAAATHTVR